MITAEAAVVDPAKSAIQEAWYVTGDGDFVLIIAARDVEDYDALVQKLVSENSNVRRLRMRVALGTLKRGCGSGR